MRPLPLLAAGFGTALLLGAGAGLAEPSEDSFRAVNADLAMHHVVPRYAELAAQTAILRERADAFCAAPAAPALATLRTSFHESLDAWQGVQHIDFGPVELFMRNMRFSFWPDPRNSMSRDIDALLAERKTQALAPESFPRGTVTLQGFPALERLLFETDGGEPLLAGGDAATFRCSFIRAITANMAGMAADTSREWSSPEGFAAKIAAAGKPDSGFEQVQDATLPFFKALHNGLMLAADVKLKPVVGDTVLAARASRAESFRTKRSLRNLKVNIQALESLYTGGKNAGFSKLVRESGTDKDLDALMVRAFGQTLATIDGIDVPLEEAAPSQKYRASLNKLQTQVAALAKLMRTRVAAALGLSVGFNGRDGDGD